MIQVILISECFIKNLSAVKMSDIFGSFKISELKKKIFSGFKTFFSMFLIDHSAVDYPFFFKKRFLFYYSLISYVIIQKLFVFFKSNNNVKSIYEVYPSSEWLERESYDFFGAFYSNHPDLRRILTDYGFPSYALRKDFPVQGFFDILFSVVSKKIQVKEIEFQQSFRVFNKENPYLGNT